MIEECPFRKYACRMFMIESINSELDALEVISFLCLTEHFGISANKHVSYCYQMVTLGNG